MTARKHHYVPEFYLKGFVFDRKKPRLFAVDLKSSSIFEPSPDNVCAERDFNRIDVDGHAPDALEMQFGTFDSEASLALRRIIGSRSITSEEDRIYVLNVIVLIAVRNPRSRWILRTFNEKLNKQIMAALVSTPEIYATQTEKTKAAGYTDENSFATYEEMRDFLKRDDYTIDAPTTGCLQVELNALDDVLLCLAKRNWVLLRAAPNSPGFITSDHPVCLRWSNPERENLFSPGYGRKETEVVFPLSKELAWVGSFEHPAEVIDADEDLVSVVNGIVLSFAERQVYGQNGDFLYRMLSTDKARRGYDLANYPHFARHAFT